MVTAINYTSMGLAQRKGFTPSEHQLRAVALARSSNKDLKIMAYAGASKTTTLILVAEALSPKSGRYLTFSKALAEDAKKTFPSVVDCSTMHSLAFRSVRPTLSSSPKAWVNSIYSTLKESGLSPSMGWTVYKIICAFCKDTTSSVTMEQVIEVLKEECGLLCGEEDVFQVSGKGSITMATQLVEVANAIWDDVAEGVLHSTHDFYVKTFSLQENIYIGEDYLMFDEQQDANPIMLEIVRKIRKQGTRIITVGDSYQAIYGFSGNVDALASTECELEAYLPISYRYGQSVADLAETILAPIKAKGEPRIIGGGSFDTSVTLGVRMPPRDTNVVICRTNRGCINSARHLILRGDNVIFEGASAVEKSLLDLVKFSKGEIPHYRGYSKFTSMTAQYIRDPLTVTDSWLVGIVLKGGEVLETLLEVLRDIITYIPREGDTPIKVITAHKSKGLDWDTVHLSNELGMPREERDGTKTFTAEEVRLFYVAATRAKKSLTVGITAKELEEVLEIARQTTLRQQQEA